jgi:hypothetical protein
LHAKVYVLGPHVFVGSANASLSARNALIECVISTDEPLAVGKARNFVVAISERADLVDDSFLNRIEGLPVTKTYLTRCKETPIVHEPSGWLLGLHEAKYPGDMEAVEEASETIEKGLKGEGEVDWFWLMPSRSRIFREARAGDAFIQVWRKKPSTRDGRGVEVSPPAVIHTISEDDDGRKIYHFVVAARSHDRALTWREFLRLVQEVGWQAEPSVGGSRIIPNEIAKALSKRWPPKAR